MKKLIAAAALLTVLTTPTLAGVAQNGTNLNGTNLNGTKFNGTNLNGTNLNGTKFNGTNLNGTKFNGTNLNGLTLNGGTDGKPCQAVDAAGRPAVCSGGIVDIELRH